MLSRGLTGSLLVLLGGLVVSVVPGSSWVMRTEVLVLLRGSEVGRMLGLTLVVAGLGLLAHSWLRLCRQVSRTESCAAEGIATSRIAAAAWSLPLLLAPPLFSRDGWSYAAQGVLAQWGLSPYRYGPGMLHGPVSEAVDPRWMWSATPYGPVPLVFGRSVASLTENPWLLVLAHRGLAVLGLLVLAWAVPRLASWTGVDPALASAMVLASPFVLANGVGGLHNDLLMVGLMAAALVVAAERGWVYGAVLGALAASVKAPAGIICIGVALVTLPLAAGPADRARRLAAVAVVSVGVLLGLGLLAGTGSGWLHALTVPGSVNTPLSVTTLVGGAGDLISQGLGLGTPDAAYLSLVRFVGTLGALGVAGWVAARWPTGLRDAALSGTALAVGALVLLSPVVHLWYLLWLLPFVVCLRLSRAAMTALVGLSVVLGLVAPLDSSLHDAYLAIIWGAMLVAALVLVLLLTPGARARVRRIAAPRWLAALDEPRQPATAGSIRPVTSPSVSRPPVSDGAE